MTILTLCWEFFKTGLFAIGGGLATLPFLTRMAHDHPDWFTTEMLANMIAVSESTPGPIGVNMATYVGYTTAGILGGLLATLSLVFPSVVIIILIYDFLKQYKENRLVQSAFGTLRPVVTGLIAAAGFSVLRMSVLTIDIAGWQIHWVQAALFVALFALTQWKKCKNLHPAVYILAGALCGVLLGLE